MADQFDFNGMISGFLLAKDEADLHHHLDRCAHGLGFSKFAMGHHVDLSGPPQDAIRVTNYDPAWIERSLGDGYFVYDPVHQASTKTAMGFLWSDIPDMIRLTNAQKAVLEAARPYGLSEGYTIPVHVPGEYRGTCSFGADSLHGLRANALPLANMIGTYAFECARRIMRSRRGGSDGPPNVPQLTDRQRDSLVLVARGKGDPEIGALLGISATTAHGHVENVRRAYGNAQRPLLVARALFDGQISYSEVFGR